MRWVDVLVLCGALVLTQTTLSSENVAPRGALRGEKAQSPAGVAEDTFAPPPVPNFMLEKPTQPLSMDEMIRQAREAEKRTNTRRAAPRQDIDATNAGATR